MVVSQINVIEHLERFAKGYGVYGQSREAGTGSTIPFRVSPSPFRVTDIETRELEGIGRLTVAYARAAFDLYKGEQDVRKILDRGKPEIFLYDEPHINYVFVRPDLIVTEDGYSICEIETSPFGLALADILAQAYQSAGFDLVVDPQILRDHARSNLPGSGSLTYSDHTSKFSGQMEFLADNVFGQDGSWDASKVDEANPAGTVYRAFYLDEALRDENVAKFLALLSKKGQQIVPSLTPFFEEKAMLALLWDRRWSGYFKRVLGISDFNKMRSVVPETWIVGQEDYFEPGMPNGISDSLGLASITKARRTFVLKNSGFSSEGAWGRGVTFLQEKSAVVASRLIDGVMRDQNSIFVIQNFKKGVKREMTYTKDGADIIMDGRVRLTPYVAFEGAKQGSLIALKATICENTNYIHASSASINTAVAK